MSRLSCLLGLLAALVLSSSVHGADLSIMPVAIHLDSTRDRTTVTVTNNGATPAVLQAGAVAWRRDGGTDRGSGQASAHGSDRDEASEDLIVNPSVFRLAPGKSQIVRIGLRRNSAADRESTYRMVLAEVPTPEGLDTTLAQGNVRVLVTLRVPVYVAPASVRRDERWQARWDEQGRLVAQVTNAGNVHYKVGAVRLQGGDAHGTVVAQGPDAVIFPGEARSYRFPTPARSSDARPLTLEVLTDGGVQQVALDVAAR